MKSCRNKISISLGLLSFSLAAFLYGGTQVLSQTTYYVNNVDGSDANSGKTEALAWKTIAKVNRSSFLPGDQVLLKRGQSWNEGIVVPSSGSPGNHILFSSYGTGPKPVLNGAIATSGWTLASGNIYQCTFPSLATVIVADGQLLRFVPWNIDVTTTFAAESPGCFSVDGNSRTAYVWLSDGSHPDTHDMQVSYAVVDNEGTGILVKNRSYVTVDGIDIRQTAGSGIMVWGVVAISNVIVQNCSVSTVGGSGIIVRGPESSEKLTACTVHKDTVFRSRQHGIVVAYRAFGSTVCHNLAINNSWNLPLRFHGISSWGPDSGTCPEGNIFEYNESYGTCSLVGPGGEGTGIQMDIPTRRSIVRYNVAHHNRGAGYACFESLDNVFYYNVAYHNGGEGFVAGGNTPGGVSIDIFNNTFYGNAHPGIEIYGAHRSANIKNNICLNNGGEFEIVIYGRGAVQADTMDYNCIYHSAGGKPFTWNYWPYDWADWKKNSGLDVHSIYAEPLFADTAAHDFRLLEGSPGINVGEVLGFRQDILGNPVVGTPNMGAYELLAPPGGTGGQAPQAPVLLLLADGARIETDSVRFCWRDQPNVDGFGFEYAFDSLFARSTDSLVTDTTVILGGLNRHPMIWWRLRAHNPVGWGPYSETRSASGSLVGVGGGPLAFDFSLEQNFPNPFNPSTTIRYTLPGKATVLLTLYDILGREVAILEQGERSAGVHEFKFDGRGFSSGVYFYRLQAGGFVETRRLLLIQ